MEEKSRVITIGTNKGGEGKTTTTAEIAGYLSKIYTDKKILIVDTDQQSNIKTIFGLKHNQVEAGFSSVLIENISPSKITYKVNNNLYVLMSGGRGMRDFERKFANVPDSEFIFQKRLSSLKEEFDFIILDTPPALSLVSSNTVTFSDYFLIPCAPSLLSLVGVKNTISFIESVKKHFSKRNKYKFTEILGIIPTMHDSRRNFDVDLIDDLENLENNDLLGGGTVFNQIRIDTKVNTSHVRRKLIQDAFPASRAAQDYLELTKNIIKRIQIHEKKSLKKQKKSSKNTSAIKM